MSPPRAPRAPSFEHAELRVADLDAALGFYTEVLGLVELERADGIVYLGCGFDDNYDLAVRAGGSGVEHFALRVDEEGLDWYAEALDEAGVDVEARDGSEPGQRRGLRFRLPSGQAMELVVVEDNRYLRPFRPAHRSASGIKPLDADHINLAVMDVKGIADFLCSVLGLRLTDAIESEPGVYHGAWLRLSDYHHDIGMLQASDPGHSLHHVAWTVANFEHMKVAADVLSQYDVELELGPGRHPIGSNLYAYFWEPGGNRFEFTAEAALIDPATPPAIWTSSEQTLDTWGTPVVPESFGRGS